MKETENNPNTGKICRAHELEELNSVKMTTLQGNLQSQCTSIKMPMTFFQKTGTNNS